MAWTDERVETLKKMWGEGQSASQIAKELGGVTRNAVIGKVHRLGLSNRGTRHPCLGSGLITKTTPLPRERWQIGTRQDIEKAAQRGKAVIRQICSDVRLEPCHASNLHSNTKRRPRTFFFAVHRLEAWQG